MEEVLYRLNKLLGSSARANVTTSAQNLDTILTISDSDKGEIKTIRINVMGANDVYFGPTNSVTISNGEGIIRAGTSREFPLIERTGLSNLYFIAAANTDCGFELWG